MKKLTILGFISLFNMLVLTNLFAQTKSLKYEIVSGKLSYDEYSEFAYFIIGKKENIGLKVEIDKTQKNQKLHKLLDKTVQVQGQMYIITADTEYQDFKYIDLRKGKGTIKEMK
jgi:hypothetical protein